MKDLSIYGTYGVNWAGPLSKGQVIQFFSRYLDKNIQATVESEVPEYVFPSFLDSDEDRVSHMLVFQHDLRFRVSMDKVGIIYHFWVAGIHPHCTYGSQWQLFKIERNPQHG